MRKITIYILLILSITGCNAIQSYRNLEQTTNTTLIASIGSTIFRLNKASDLPNVLGKADLYGGKINNGYAELKLLSIDRNGILQLKVHDISLSSSETTMDRYLNKTTVDIKNSVNINDTEPDSISGTIIHFDSKKEKTLNISGILVTFTKIDPYNVSYTLHDTRK